MIKLVCNKIKSSGEFMKITLKNSSVLSGFIGLVLTSIILLTAYFAGEMFPFGEGTVSWCDMNQQAIPLLCDFKDILSGKSSLFLNTQNAGGMNFYGVFFFNLSSPFSFLAAFVDKSQIPYLMNILVVLKLGLCGFCAGFVFYRLFKENGVLISAFLGTCYALCGYGMLFYQNIMWLDMMYLFPIVALGIFKLIKQNRPAVLLISLTLCVIFNFYISFMVYLALILFFGLYALFFRNTDRKIYVNLGLCGVISLTVSAFVWVPCLLQYFSSGRSGSILSNLKNASLFTSTETTFPILLCSGVILCGVVFLFRRVSPKDKQTSFLFCLFLIMSVPLIIEPINLMWHTGSYMAFPARYGFITVFAGLCLTAKLLSGWKFAEKPKPNAVFIYFAVGLICILALIFTLSNQDTLSTYTRTLWGNKASLRGQIFISLLFVLSYFIILLFSERKVLCKKTAAVFLCLCLAFEGFCWSSVFVLSAKDRFSMHNFQNMLELRSEIQKDGFYRVNTSHKLTDANMTGAAGFNSLAHYTSLNNENYMEAAKQMGYSGYWMETGNWGGSILSDALLSVGYTVYNQNGEFVIKENPYYLGLGIKTEGEIPEKLSHKNRLATLGEAFGKMTDTENPVVTYYAYNTENCNLLTQDDVYVINSVSDETYITYSVDVIGRQTLYFDCYDGFSNSLVEDINQSFEVYVNSSVKSCSYPTQKENGLLKLGGFENESVDITIKVLKEVSCSSFGVFGVKEDLVENVVQNTETLNLTQKGGVLSGNAGKGNYFLSIPYSEDLNITLNGEKMEFSKALSGFISLEIPRDGVLKIGLTPKGFGLGICVSVLGTVALLFMIFLRKKEISKGEKSDNIVYGIFLGVFALTAVLVYVIPVIVSLSDFKI